MLLQLEEMVQKAVPETVTIITSGGGGGNNNFGGGGGGGQTNRGQIRLILKPRDQRTRTTEDISIALRRTLSGLPGVVVRANPTGGNFQLNRLLGGGSGNQGGDSRVSLEIRGHDLDDARRIAQDAREVMEDTPGIADVRIGREEGRPEISVRVDRPKAAMLGMTVSGVATTIQTNVAGTTAAQFRERGNEYPIVVRLREADREEISDVGDVLLSTPSGQVVPARNVMATTRDAGPVQIDRKNMERVTRVNAETEIPLSEAVAAVQQRIGQIRVPPDFSVGFGSEVEEQAKSFEQLRLVLILAVLLVYAVMASQYESLRDPFIIMFSIPVAAIGVVLTLMWTEHAVQHAGLHRHHHAGGHRRQQRHPAGGLRQHAPAARQPAAARGRGARRPHSAASDSDDVDRDDAGLVPMALGLGDGGELQAPLARVVIGGLLASTIVTLVLVPAVYTVFEEGLAGLRRGMAEATADRGSGHPG